MPWITIILTLLSFFATKSSTGSTSKAALAAALVGGATYAFTHSDFANGTALAEYDGAPVASSPVLDGSGNPVVDANGAPIRAPGAVIPVAGPVPGTSVLQPVADVLKSWGATGTSTVIGTTALATSNSLQKYLPWLVGAAALFLLSR